MLIAIGVLIGAYIIGALIKTHIGRGALIGRRVLNRIITVVRISVIVRKKALEGLIKKKQLQCMILSDKKSSCSDACQLWF